MLAHAIDHPAPRTFILISGDRDFSYCLATLRLRRYKVVLVTLPNAHPSLKAQASVCLDWFTDVVNLITPPPSSPKKTRKISSDSSNGRYADTTSGVQSNPSRYFVSTDSDEEVAYTGVKPTPSPGPSTTNLLQRQLSAFPSPTSPIKSPNKYSLNEGIQTPPASRLLSSLPERQLFQPPPRPPLRETTSSLLEARPPSASSTTGSEVHRANALEWHPPAANLRIPSPPQENARSQTRLRAGLNHAFFGSLEGAPNDTIAPPPEPERRQPPATSPLLEPQKAFTVKATSPSPGLLKGQSTTPDPFKPLVRQLQWYHSHGNYIVLRSTLGYDLVSRYNGVYKKAGVKKFMEYASMAEKFGIVELGGTGAESWIRLLPGWEKAGTK
jgi:NYN domain